MKRDQRRHRPRIRTGHLALILLFAIVVAGITLLGRQQPNNNHAPGSIACDGSDVTTALQSAVDGGGTVTLSAGTCVLTNHIKLTHAVTINGAGMTATHLVQHGRYNIFALTADNVTLENFDINTATYNPGTPGCTTTATCPVLTIYGTGNNTTLLNFSSEAGSGFGMRFTGPQPCDTYQRHGLTATNVSSTNTGIGGYTAFDVDCHNGFALNGVTIHGDYIALFKSENGTVKNETFTQGPYVKITCPPDIFVTGNASNIDINGVTSLGGHHVFRSGTLTNITIENEVITKAGC